MTAIKINKMMNSKPLYSHQQRFLEKNPDKALLVWETQTGKTRAACEWLKKRAHVKALVVCPKGIVEKWRRELKEWGAVADVVSRDGVKKIDLKNYGCLVLDEAHDFSAPLFEKSRSQRATAIYQYVKSRSRAHVLLTTATPVRSSPWNCHTLACYLGVYWDVKKFRNTFFHLTDIFGRWHYEPNKDWRFKIRPYLESISDIVLMSDCVDVPVQHKQVIEIPWTAAQEKGLIKPGEYLEPSAAWYRRHRAEQGEPKFKKLMEILGGYRKAIVVCFYREQMEEYAKKIGGERQVFMLYGGVKDQDAVIEAAKSADDCIFLLQASMGCGFSASEFSVIVYASMPFSYLHYVQSKGRIKVISDLKETTLIHLLAGKCDKAVYNCIENGKDFDPIQYLAP